MNAWGQLIDPQTELTRRLMPVRRVPPKQTKAPKRTREYPTSTPWKLPPQVRLTVEAVLEAGCEAGAAELRGVGVKTIQKQMNTARKLMQIPIRLHALIAYDRWKRGEE